MSRKPRQRGKSEPSRRVHYSPETASRVCDEIATGRSLREICETEDWAPGETAFHGWLCGRIVGMEESERDSLCEQYARAMERRCDVLAEEALKIAADATSENAQAKRLHFDAIRWFAGKVAPKRYGDRVGLEHSGKDGGPLKVEVEFIGGE